MKNNYFECKSKLFLSKEIEISFYGFCTGMWSGWKSETRI